MINCYTSTTYLTNTDKRKKNKKDDQKEVMNVNEIIER